MERQYIIFCALLYTMGGLLVVRKRLVFLKESIGITESSFASLICKILIFLEWPVFVFVGILLFFESSFFSFTLFGGLKDCRDNRRNHNSIQFGPYAEPWMIIVCGTCRRKEWFVNTNFVYNFGTKNSIASGGGYLGLPIGYYCVPCLKAFLLEREKERHREKKTGIENEKESL